MTQELVVVKIVGWPAWPIGSCQRKGLAWVFETSQNN